MKIVAKRSSVRYFLQAIRYVVSCAGILLVCLVLGGLLGFGLAALYYAANLLIKFVGILLGTSILWPLALVVKWFGLRDLRGWMAVFGYLGAETAILLRVVSSSHRPWWAVLLIALSTGVLLTVVILRNTSPNMAPPVGFIFPNPSMPLIAPVAWDQQRYDSYQAAKARAEAEAVNANLMAYARAINQAVTQQSLSHNQPRQAPLRQERDKPLP